MAILAALCLWWNGKYCFCRTSYRFYYFSLLYLVFVIYIITLSFELTCSRKDAKICWSTNSFFLWKSIFAKHYFEYIALGQMANSWKMVDCDLYLALRWYIISTPNIWKVFKIQSFAWGYAIRQSTILFYWYL